MYGSSVNEGTHYKAAHAGVFRCQQRDLKLAAKQFKRS
jgi:hypothetical protein